MHVADLLHLQAALQTDGIVDAAADEEGHLGVGELRGEPLDALLVLDHALDLVRDGAQLGEQADILGLVDHAARARHCDGDQIAHDQLGAVRLGGGHGDLRAGVGVDDVIGLAGDGRAHDVDDGEGVHALALGLAQRREAVGGLAALADDDHQRLRREQRLAVAELRRDVHAHRDARQILHHVLRNHAHVVGGAAGHDMHLLVGAQHLLGDARLAQIHAAVAHEGVDGVRHHAGLLVNLLHHEVLEAGLLRGLRVPGDLHGMLLDGLLIHGAEADRALAQAGDLHVVDVVDAAGVLQDRRNVRGQIGRVALHADDHRAVAAGGEDLARIVLEHDRQGIGAADAHHAAGHGLHRASLVLVVVVVDQLGGDLGVGLAVEGVAVLDQLLAQELIVFDDAVVHQNHGVAVAVVGMGVVRGGLAVGRPAGVADAAATPERHAAVGLFAELLQPALRLHDLDGTVAVAHRKARGIVAAVLQLGQAVQQNRRRQFISNVSNNAAHMYQPPSLRISAPCILSANARIPH